MCSLDTMRCRYTEQSQAPVASSSVAKPMSLRKMVDELAKKKETPFHGKRKLTKER